MRVKIIDLILLLALFGFALIGCGLQEQPGQMTEPSADRFETEEPAPTPGSAEQETQTAEEQTEPVVTDPLETESPATESQATENQETEPPMTDIPDLGQGIILPDDEF